MIYRQKDKIGHYLKLENEKKYLKPPTLMQIEQFLKELDITTASFERFYGIPLGTIRKIRHGDNGRYLPVKFWHIIYEKIVPAYGSGFLNPDQPRIEIKKTKSILHKTEISKKALERLSQL